jgi:putative oxidoreductase
MKHVPTIARILLGLIFFVFGLNFWLKFAPIPPPPEGNAAAFIGALYASGFLTVVKVLEVIGGALLLSGRFVCVGLTLLTPIVVCIALYDFLLVGKANPVILLSIVLTAVLLNAHRRTFGPVLKA